MRELVSLLALLLLLLGDMAHQSTRVGSLSNDILAGGGVNSWLAVIVGVTTLLWRHRLMARVDLFWDPLGMAGVAVAVVAVVLARLGVVLVLILALVLQSGGQTAFPVIIVIVGSLGTGV